MEQIRQAVERAKAVGASAPTAAAPFGTNGARADATLGARPAIPINPMMPGLERVAREAELNREHLEAHRIVAHQAADPRSKSFDMLRTQVLQSMDQNNWQIVAVTSPTAGCGKTLTATNLALSIARQAERSAFLLDLDLHKPQVGSCLGLRSKVGVVSVLEGRSSLADATTLARVGSHHIMVLPAESRVVDSSELIASRAMGKMLQDIRQGFSSRTVVVDLPPILSSDDVIALLPQIDCVLLVAAVGTSTVSEMKECHNHLQSASVLRIVLNKAAESAAGYY